MASRIGFIGLGIMGKPMARNLLKAGFSLIVHNRSRAKVDELVKEGATAATSPREVASAADIVITMLPNSPDVEKVALGIGSDRRIGPSFLNAGIGYGGFCLPKDIEAFIRIAEKLGYDYKLLKAVKEINEAQRHSIVIKVEKRLWNLKDKQIGVLGLAFKPDTDDMRFAPSIDVINSLTKAGARIKAFDPQAMKEAGKVLNGVTFARNAYETAKGSDCLILLTEWTEFKKLDLKRLKRLMRQPILVDGRNLYDPELVRKVGFTYVGVGRG